MHKKLDHKTALYLQVRDDIVDKIRSGELTADTRLPGERELAAQYGLSRGTIKQALQLLETENFIERIPSKGAFIKDASEELSKPLNIIFPFPEKEISPQYIDYANWVADTEIYRGMISACSKYNTRVTFQYFEESQSSSVMRKQFKYCQEFDAAIFIGWQFEDLKQELLKNKFPLVSIHSGGIKRYSGPTVHYNRDDIIREAANYIVSCGYRSAGMLLAEKDDLSKEKICRNIFKKNQIEFSSDWCLLTPHNEDKAYQFLKKELPENSKELPEIFFCNTSTFSFALLKLAKERNWRIPEDISILGYANNMNYRQTDPILTHVYIPYFEMGIETCRFLREAIDNKSIIPAKLIEGQTTYKR